MKLLPGTILDYSALEEVEEITYSDILEWLMDKLDLSDYKSIELDTHDDERLLSIEMAKQLAMGKMIDQYPEKLEYHFYWYPHEKKHVCEATFTKQEFLDSIKKDKEKRK